MKRIFGIAALILVPLAFAAKDEEKVAPLPEAVTNNAVASVKSRGDFLIFSFMGMGAKKTWDAVANASYVLEPDGEKWQAIRPVPGSAGRIAAAAAGAREHIFLFGGYVIDSGNHGRVVPDASVYEPLTQRWGRAEDTPVPVADTVIGVYRDRFIYLVGGRSNNGITSKVQIYDGQKNAWAEGTPYPGTPVYGHAGALLDDTIVYVDGAARNSSGEGARYVPSEECWMGKIDHHDMTKITWSKLPAHPGSARFRIAAGASEKDHRIYFAGGADTAYDYDGIGFSQKPAEPSGAVFVFDVKSGKWETITENSPSPFMDEHGLIITRDGLMVIGGMEKGQNITPRVMVLPTRAKAR